MTLWHWRKHVSLVAQHRTECFLAVSNMIVFACKENAYSQLYEELKGKEGRKSSTS